MKTTKDIITFLSEQGYKKTRVRETLISHLENLKKPLSALEIQMFFLKKKLQVNKSTIYRELQFLLDRKVIVEINFGEGRKRYEIAGLPHHHHLICSNCQNVDDIFIAGDLEVVEKKIKKEKSFIIKYHTLEFFGLCKNCA